MEFINNKTKLFTFLSFIFSLIGTLIYTLIPSSGFANDVQYSSTLAIKILVLSPLCFIAAFVLHILVFEKDFKTWSKHVDKVILLPVLALSAFGFIFNIISSVILIAEFSSLGFVAPISGTVWAKLGVAMAIFTVLFLVIFGAIILLTKKYKKQ